MSITIIGGGLAGCEAAYQISKRGIKVILFEMRPEVKTAAHHTDQLAELVCSNSFKSNETHDASGLLKEEMRLCSSFIIKAADGTKVPAGKALAVDREEFAEGITRAIDTDENITVVREEVKSIPDGIVIIAAGPLMSDSLAGQVAQFTGEKNLSFYDAISPIVLADSLNHDRIFPASRYGKGDDYLNCPLTDKEYNRFYEELIGASKAFLRDIDRNLVFEGCLPIEEMALRGKETLRYGPMRPVGLADPRTNRQPYAVVQLRQDNIAASHYSLVGFQNQLKSGEQERVFRLIPGLENCEFVRFGMIHRNTFINAPATLLPTFQTQRRDDLFFGGQLSGVEGYVESAASGLIAGINAARLSKGKEAVPFPKETALGSLANYITSADPLHYQPANITYGLFTPLPSHVRGKRNRRHRFSRRALSFLEEFIDGNLNHIKQ
jgi:methylenetetrahydrofolate--tRNA-(uracil-5-)-methyltransferase